MKKVLEFIDNFTQEDYQDELESFNQEITSKYDIPKIFLEHVFQKHLISLIENPEKYCYLECGVFLGRTLLVSALANFNLLCVGVDRWIYQTKDRCLSNIEKSGLKNIKVITSSYQEFFKYQTNELENKKIKVYFYDADHSFADQKQGLIDVLPHLADEAIILVDDTDGTDTGPRRATLQFIQENSNFEVIRDFTTKLGFSVGTIVLRKIR